MFGINIITKSGILVFSHSFVGNYLLEIDSDIDIQAGLISAVLSALRETRGETVTAIRYREYMLLLYEGVLTYGIIFTVEDDPKLHEFLKKIVLKFEIVYTDELYKETVLNRMDFENFRIIVRNQYAEMITIDVTTLDRLIKIMRPTTIKNYIIYETKFFHPVFTKITDPLITANLPQITRIYRDISDLEKKINQEQTTSEILFTNIHFYEIKTPTHCVVLFYSSLNKDKSTFTREITQIQRKMVNQ
ncbi:MAG: hypothetical protein JSW11_08945 [Candidatus Heimdallarchaeota archaeon]|nr:MAG: hypothetical protein JSW11_08945 [Candidatus Heimdallarchaeota archaeon]